MVIYRYVIVDEDNREEDSEYQSMDEAINMIPKDGRHWAVRERVYEGIMDENVVWTSTGDDVWPPEEVV